MFFNLFIETYLASGGGEMAFLGSLRGARRAIAGRRMGAKWALNGRYVGAERAVGWSWVTTSRMVAFANSGQGCPRLREARREARLGVMGKLRHCGGLVARERRVKRRRS